MAVADYSLRLAEKHVEEYDERDKKLIAAYRAAMKCRDCEEFLQLGIDACKFIRQADTVLRQAAVEGLEVPVEAKDALSRLYRGWLAPCPRAEERIKQQEMQGFKPSNLKEFRDACEYVTQQVRLLDMEKHLESAFQGQVFDEDFWLEAHKMRSA
jgi:hypothetical protein